jgi:hypothetical protein
MFKISVEPKRIQDVEAARTGLSRVAAIDDRARQTPRSRVIGEARQQRRDDGTAIDTDLRHLDRIAVLGHEATITTPDLSGPRS